jgi:hypothetical protein
LLSESRVQRDGFKLIAERWILPWSVSTVWAGAIVFACVILRLGWISDVPFIWDEPKLFLNALEANAKGTWAARGLQGSQGVHYGPLPTWIYQIFLMVFSSPIEIAFAKALLITLITISCLWVWAKKVQGVERALVGIALLSPYLWFYARDLWDNSWLIPVSLVTWTSYLHFDQQPSLRRLFLPAMGVASLILIHLMSLPLIGALGLHFAVKHRKWILRRWAGVVVFVLLVVAIDFPYLSQIASLPNQGAKETEPLAFWYLLVQGLSYFSAYKFDYFLGPAWMDVAVFPRSIQILLRVSSGLSLLSFLFFAAGLVQAVRLFVSALFPRRPVPPPLVSPWVQVSDLVAVLTVALFLCLAFVKGLSEHPHYYNGVWPALFYLFWRGACYVWKYRNDAFPSWAGPAVVSVWILAMILSLGGIVSRVHFGHGSRSVRYGPTLGNMWEVSERLFRLEGAEIIPVAVHARYFPEGLLALVEMRLVQAAIPEAAENPGRWLINYRNSKQTWDGGIELVPYSGKQTELRKAPKEPAKSVEK